MRILFLTNLFPTPWQPTRGVYNLQAFQALSSRASVRGIVPVPWWTRRVGDWWSVRRCDNFGLDVSYPVYWSLPGQTHLHARGMYYSLRSYVAGLFRQEPFDLILAAWAYPDGVAAARLAREMQVPLVTMILGSDINELARRPALREQIRWGLNQARFVVTVSHALKDRVMELGIPDDQIVVQHNGVDGDRFQIGDREAARERLGLSRGKRIVCYIGNLVPEKGIDVLLDSVSILSRFDLDSEIAVVGSGSLEGKLRRQVAERSLGERIRFYGSRPHQEIPDWMCACDVLCLPSYREGCPNVVLEALASGRPVVASSVGGVPELLDESCGILVPPANPTQLAEGIIQALNRSWSPIKLRDSVEYPSWDQFGQRLSNILRQTLEDGNFRSRRSGIVNDTPKDEFINRGLK